jgi:hypothetical protein
MQARHWAVSLCTLALDCAFPRGGLQMQTADRLGSGNAEVGLGAGLAYTGASQSAGGFTANSNTLQFPLMEANARIGLSDMFDVNVHLGAGGLEPGFKIGFTAGPLELAAMPSIGVGVYRTSSSSGATSSGYTVVNVQGGLHLMASLQMGGYFGVGYWFQYANYSSDGTGVGGTTGNSNITGHNLGFNLGWNLELGALRVRPEVGFLLLLGAQQSSSGISQSSPVQFTFMPAVTIAAGTPKKPK